MKNEVVEKLLQKQMDRKGFLKHVAIGFAALTGIAAVVKTLGSMGSTETAQAKGYGSSAYGGSKVSGDTNKL